MFADMMRSPAWQIATWTMIHFLWVGTAVAMVTGLIRWILHRRWLFPDSPHLRYGVAVLMLVLLAISPIAIAVGLVRQFEPAVGPAADQTIDLAEWPVGELVGSIESSSSSRSHFDTGQRSAIVTSAPISTSTNLWNGSVAAAWLPLVWLVGSPLTLLWFTAGLVGADRLRRRSQSILNGPINAALVRLVARWPTRVPVVVASCASLRLPVLVGVVRPMILLPPALLANCSATELEMILLHELAHVRRWDNLVNLAQRVVEALLFYHPAVWIISNWVRREREHCCDQFVVAATGRPRQYVRLLAALADGDFKTSELVTSAMARRDVMARIRTILRAEQQTMKISMRIWSWSIIAVLMVLGGGLLGATLNKSDDPSPDRQGNGGDLTDVAAQDEATAGGAELLDLPSALGNQPPPKKTSEADLFAVEGAGNEVAKSDETEIPADAILTAIVQKGNGQEAWFKSVRQPRPTVIRVGSKFTVAGRRWTLSGIDAKGVRLSSTGVAMKVPIGASLRASLQLPGKRTAPPTVSRDALRYDGKSFDDWRQSWRTELKPELRIEALNALAAFGANGYSRESARTVLEVMRHYAQPSRINSRNARGDLRIIVAAREALWKIGPQCLPEVISGLQSADTNVRRFAAGFLESTDWDTQGVVSDLVASTRDEDPQVVQKIIGRLSTRHLSDPGVIEALLALTNKSSVELVRVRAIEELARLSLVSMPASVAAQLEALLNDKSRPVQLAAIRTLTYGGGIGQPPSSMAGGAPGMGGIPGLGMGMGAGAMGLGGEGGMGGYAEEPKPLRKILDFVRQLPKDPKQRTAILVDAVRNDGGELASVAAVLLIRMGPQARSAVKRIRAGSNQKLQQRVRRILLWMDHIDRSANPDTEGGLDAADGLELDDLEAAGGEGVGAAAARPAASSESPGGGGDGGLVPLQGLPGLGAPGSGR